MWCIHTATSISAAFTYSVNFVEQDNMHRITMYRDVYRIVKSLPKSSLNINRFCPQGPNPAACSISVQNQCALFVCFFQIFLGGFVALFFSTGDWRVDRKRRQERESEMQQRATEWYWTQDAAARTQPRPTESRLSYRGVPNSAHWFAMTELIFSLKHCAVVFEVLSFACVRDITQSAETCK